jgi:cobalt-zinc-cadmium resistance protein CzcA
MQCIMINCYKMLNKIIQFSIKNKLIVGLLTIVLICWGLWSATRLPIDAVPDITNNQVQIITTAPSQSALDIERLITFPVEQIMSTIPHIKEVRSFSRFGLSVVTIVFKDEVDVYWARQQVSERLNEVKNEIPAGIGTPKLAPVTTGLGEIYQYILRAKKGYEDKYTPTDLRTIQDWIVRRQLLGTAGVADVSSFGGYFKQYEISIDPNKLNSYNLSIQNVFTALQNNNQNTGGSYIEQGPKTYFISSEGLVNSKDDIGKIVVTNTAQGIPILIRDIAEVNIGHAPRYGAMTYNNEGEVVGAVVMMLKGENSSAVVNRVKEKMKQIERTLPEGVEVEVFLDRSSLVKRAIGTVEKNLIEGALIVILVLILFLGNFRAGLIVASVIPLAMLFAIAMMNLFGVSGNLMSLGAIDFGLIVDGAVIIVEATLHHLGMRRTVGKLTQNEMDSEVYNSASKIRTAAAFGEIIILIVYLPILVLVGIEGKMFKPMAQTVSFAILGAFILSLTYVPMMSALLLSKNIIHKKTISDRMMDFFQRLYTPVIQFSLKRKSLVIIISSIIFLISIFTFTRMGGEFLPTLEEGDFAVETRVLTGSSISKTVEASLKGSNLLLAEFPDEVEKVVGKIGSGEIPTDPMPIEACDLMVILKPKSKWKKAHNREELAEKMREALEKIPGVTFGFQQPIQMRFNELMTGVKQDVAVKIYGEDLNILSDLSKQIGELVGTVKGAQDLYVEEVTGLDQILVTINRDQVAKYGLDIETINRTINAAFAGQSAGLVYEGEKKFDLVVRLNQENRSNIEDIRSLYITTPGGLQIPLEQLADVRDTVCPNQIQREDAKRRIIVGFNVRGRDIASVVKELQQKIDEQIDFPAGYYPDYGGQFENLQQANARLAVSVPVALILIFLLLYFTFGSLKHSLLIFTSIPMSAIGGIYALLIRGMPFSISAGIGFIALFGVAVLNGIVLISEFNRLKKEGMTDLKEIVLLGTKVRLRPVLMTAMVASLGFLPMALATSAGAEVQKPLATVVIGGLISSTLLTLILLPCLYIYFENIGKKKLKPVSTIVIILFLFLGANSVEAQSRIVTLDSVIHITESNNKILQIADAEIGYYQQLRLASTDMPKTMVGLLYGQYNGYASNDNNISISQTVPFPSLFVARGQLSKSQIEGVEYKKENTRSQLIYQVKQTYFQILYLKEFERQLIELDTIYLGIVKSSDWRYKTGEGTLLEKTTAETMHNDLQNKLMQNKADLEGQFFLLQSFMGISNKLELAGDTLYQLPFIFSLDSSSILSNPYLAMLKQEIEIADKQKGVTVNTILPDITLGYFNQTLIGVPLDGNINAPIATVNNRFQGFQVGLSIPLWIGPHISKVKADKQQIKMATLNYEYNENLLMGEYKKAIQLYLKEKANLDYYLNSGLPNAKLIITQSQLAYQTGDISYNTHLSNLQQATSIQLGYLLAINNYNQSILYLELLTGTN